MRRQPQYPKNLTLVLTDGAAATDLWAEDVLVQHPELLLGSFAADVQQLAGWNELVRDGPTPQMLIANETLTIVWPAPG